jgi:prepilin-type processing-associated H-X9-DG protein
MGHCWVRLSRDAIALNKDDPIARLGKLGALLHNFAKPRPSIAGLPPNPLYADGHVLMFTPDVILPAQAA